ncbi:hypothetical protein J7E50_05450 [Pedobacter sp. ISL-68]|uniref:hypothetical protein n=1 Tax=unclassified Pedobacter TaxID=2628915 RepID=UPI001BEBA71C|nr:MULTISPECIES: hypothetical protein [unclassified Pedobacter]MBT2563761.1 hypothetical protein [Pedobacter sp. ISL-64]MBT2589653.1 hypothetical protein [Pedobacter sp. ISL-68]
MFDHVIKILGSLDQLDRRYDQLEEQWGSLKIGGVAFPNFYPWALSFLKTLGQAGLSAMPRLELDGQYYNSEDLEEAREFGFVYKYWTIHLNKSILYQMAQEDGFFYNFFFSSAHCLSWLKAVGPFNSDEPLSSYAKLKVLINGLKAPFGNSTLYFLPPRAGLDTLTYPAIRGLPKAAQIQEHVHFVTDNAFSAEPERYVLTSGDFSSLMANEVMKKGASSMAIALVHEFYSSQKLIVEGVKRLPMKLMDTPNLTLTDTFYRRLTDLIIWVYQDKVTIRKKLFSERLGLDLDQEKGLIENLMEHISPAFEQAQQRYNFVIIERKDAYLKELRDLLKDLKGQSDLYALKVRTLLSNFLRDLLAAIVLVGFTIFTKFSDSVKLENIKLLDVVFYVLSAYYMFSILMQSVVDIFDVSVSKKELLYWKRAAKDYISEKDFKDHVFLSLKGRRISLYIVYPTVALCYILISLACLYFPSYFRAHFIKH